MSADWMAVHLMARTRPTWRSPQTLVFVIVLFVVSFAILALIDAHTITAHAERCPYQFPTKWFGCVLANHESVSGGLVGVVGALLAAWFAWHAIMAQIESNRAATMVQIESDRAIARKADRAYVTGGPGRRMADENQNHIGIVSTGMNTGQTPAFTKKVYWGICRKDDWLDVGKNWPQVKEAKCEDWEEVLPPQMAPGDRYLIACTATLIPDDGKDYVCYGTIVYTTVFGDEFTTSWKHSVVRVKVKHEGKVLTVLQTDGLPGGYSSEWEERRDASRIL
jgi:hypothetical protein